MKDLILKRSPPSSRPDSEEHELLEELLMTPDFYWGGNPDADEEDESHIDGFRRFGGSHGIAYLHHQRLIGRNY